MNLTFRKGMKYPYIDITDDFFGCLLNCAVRYALGRQTYMVGVVIDEITPLLPYVSDRTIGIFIQDVSNPLCGSWGDEKIDKPAWMKFLDDVKHERSRRKAEDAENE